MRNRAAVSWCQFCLSCLVITAVSQPAVFAAGTTVINEDRNYWIAMIDALADDQRTRLFYVTYPDVQQAHVREKCTANYYLLELQPGLANPQPKRLAENYCGHSLKKSGALLANGDAVIVSADRFETWRLGTGKVKAWSLSNVKSLQRHAQTLSADGTSADVSPDGNVVVAGIIPRKRNDKTTPSGVVAGLSADGAMRWKIEPAEAGVLISPMDVWATVDGGALLHAAVKPMSGIGIPGAPAPEGTVIIGQSRLYRISAGGELLSSIVVANMQMLDASKPQPPLPDMTTDPEGFQAELRRRMDLGRGDSTPYTTDQLIAHPRDDGSIDVLMGRETRQARIMRISRDGRILLNSLLDDVIAEEGLNRWNDGYATDQQVILFGAISTREFRLNQAYVSWIDIPDGGVITRIAPLSGLGRDEANKAGDEQVQFLEHNPSHQPQLITRLGGKPLMVSLVQRSSRPAIQLDEATEQLVAYTEARDERTAKAAKETQRQQRKAERAARRQEFDNEMAAIVGVSPEDYAAMSNNERDEAMVRHGDIDEMMAAATKQVAMMQQAIAQTGGDPNQSGGDTNAQMAAAMAQLQQMANDQGVSTPNKPPASGSQAAGTSPAAPVTGDVLRLDAGQRGFVEYEHPQGNATALVITDKQTGKELLKKDYPDGTIYEYIDFSRFGLPLNRIDVVYRDAGNHTLRNPALVIE